MSGPCKNCRQPMADFVERDHEHCSVYCAVMGLAGIDGLSDVEIAKSFTAELFAALDADGADDLRALQRGLAALLLWMVCGDRDPGRGCIEANLAAFLKISKAQP